MSPSVELVTKSVTGVPFVARESKCGAKACTRSVGAVRLAAISRSISPVAILEGSKKLKLFWIPALMRTVSRLGKSLMMPAVCFWSVEKSVMSNYISSQRLLKGQVSNNPGHWVYRPGVSPIRLVP